MVVKEVISSSPQTKALTALTLQAVDCAPLSPQYKTVLAAIDVVSQVAKA